MNKLVNQLLVILFISITCFQCGKSVNAPETHETLNTENSMKSDTINKGSYLDFNIGDSARTCYMHFQEVYGSDSYLSIDSNCFRNNPELVNLIPLYTAVYCDGDTGSPDGLQISFKGDTIESLYLNSGDKLTQWPVECNGTNCIKVGDSRKDAAVKIVAHSDKFTRVSFFEKDVSTPADSIMLTRSQWTFTQISGPDSLHEIHLQFERSILIKIIINYWKLWRPV